MHAISVPLWLVLIQTIAAPILGGGFALLATFIVPKAAREARQIEQQDRRNELMRSKAEAIFAMLAKSRFATIEMMRDFDAPLRAGDPVGPLNATPFRVYDEIWGIAATYYPSLLSIIKQEYEAISAAIAKDQKAVESGLLSASEFEKAKVRMSGDAAIQAGKGMRKIEVRLAELVAPYTPIPSKQQGSTIGFWKLRAQ